MTDITAPSTRDLLAFAVRVVARPTGKMWLMWGIVILAIIISTVIYMGKYEQSLRAIEGVENTNLTELFEGMASFNYMILQIIFITFLEFYLIQSLMGISRHRYFLRYGLVTCFFIIILLPIFGALVFVDFAIAEAMGRSMLLEEPSSNPIIYIVIMAVLMLPYIAVLTGFGLALPAAAKGVRMKLRTAFRVSRGLRTPMFKALAIVMLPSAVFESILDVAQINPMLVMALTTIPTVISSLLSGVILYCVYDAIYGADALSTAFD